MKNGFPAPNKELAINRKTPLDRESPIQVRIHLPPARSIANLTFGAHSIGEPKVGTHPARHFPVTRLQLSRARFRSARPCLLLASAERVNKYDPIARVQLGISTQQSQRSSIAKRIVFLRRSARWNRHNNVSRILKVSCVAPVSRWPDSRPRNESGSRRVPFFENRSDNKLAGVSVVMLHVETVVIIFSARLNRAVTSQKTLVMRKRALDIEKFDH